MPVLSRRRSLDHRQECWLIYYGDIHAGTIERVGNPHDTEPWEWRCGFYPSSRPGECTSRTAATFDRPRADFEQACAGISIEADGGQFSGMGNIFSLR